MVYSLMMWKATWKTSTTTRICVRHAIGATKILESSNHRPENSFSSRYCLCVMKTTMVLSMRGEDYDGGQSSNILFFFNEHNSLHSILCFNKTLVHETGSW